MASVTMQVPDDVLARIKNGSDEPAEALRLAAAFSLCSRGELSTSQAARNAAAALGIAYRGTLGVVISAKTQGLIPAARPVVEQLRQNGMYLSDQVMNQALAQVGE